MDASVCIEQKGTVEEISSHNIRVRTHREASCGHCNARGMCYLGDGTERIVEIGDFAADLKIGDTVGITISRSMGNKAIFLGYLIPFLLLLGTLIAVDQLGAEEWLTGLLSLGILVPYFIILYFLRNRLRKTFVLSARKN